MYWNRNLWLMTKKKVMRNFGGWKSRNFSGKGKMLKIFYRVWTFFENRGKSETGGKCIMVSGGMDAPGINIVGEDFAWQFQHNNFVSRRGLNHTGLVQSAIKWHAIAYLTLPHLSVLLHICGVLGYNDMCLINLHMMIAIIRISFWSDLIRS